MVVALLNSISLQMKGWWESNINVWFRFIYSQKWNYAAWYFQNRITMFCLPISTFMYLWAIYIFPGLVCLFCCSKIGRPILGIYHSQIHECRNWERGCAASFLGIHKSDFQYSDINWIWWYPSFFVCCCVYLVCPIIHVTLHLLYMRRGS